MSTYSARKQNAVTASGTLRHFEDLPQLTAADWFQRLNSKPSDKEISVGTLPALRANRDLSFLLLPTEVGALEIAPDVCKHALANRHVFFQAF